MAHSPGSGGAVPFAPLLIAVGGGAPHHVVERVRLAQIALGCTVGFADVLIEEFDWRDGRPNLSAWYDEFAKRPSMRSTMPKR